MKKSREYDLCYVTNDSISEGVGSSQIVPLVKGLSSLGLKVNLISLEKTLPDNALGNDLLQAKVDWTPLPFGEFGMISGIGRIEKLRQAIPTTKLIHGRSDVPTVAAIFSGKAPVLWDVRSLWADQKFLVREQLHQKLGYSAYRKLEDIACSKSAGLSTLTSAVVSVLASRHKTLPIRRIVVPTAVDLEKFSLSRQIPRKLKVLFSGTYSQYYDLELSARFIKEFKKKRMLEVHWAKPAESVTLSLNVGEEKIFTVSQTIMPQIIHEYAFGLAVCKLNAGPSLSAAMPTKIAELLATGRPVVVNKGLGDMDELLLNSGAGVVLDGSTSNLIESVDRLIDLVENPETPMKCRELAESHFDLKVGIAKYNKLYNSLLQ
jgi:glycosyltransferase involved in cell wall biosynthesis